MRARCELKKNVFSFEKKIRRVTLQGQVRKCGLKSPSAPWSAWLLPGKKERMNEREKLLSVWRHNSGNLGPCHLCTLHKWLTKRGAKMFKVTWIIFLNVSTCEGSIQVCVTRWLSLRFSLKIDFEDFEVVAFDSVFLEGTFASARWRTEKIGGTKNGSRLASV